MLQFFANIPYPWNYFSMSCIPITFSSNILYPGNFFCEYPISQKPLMGPLYWYTPPGMAKFFCATNKVSGYLMKHWVETLFRMFKILSNNSTVCLVNFRFEIFWRTLDHKKLYQTTWLWFSLFLIIKVEGYLEWRRLRVVPHFSSGIVEQAKRERTWKSPHAKKRRHAAGREKMHSLYYTWGKMGDYS